MFLSTTKTWQDIKLAFSKYFTRIGASIKKIIYDQEFVDWTKNSTKVEIPKNQDLINICRKCSENYDQHNQSETVDLTIKDSLEALSITKYF